MTTGKKYLSTLTLTIAAAMSVSGQPERVIFDTDITSDCDDVGALAVLHHLADHGEAELLAVTVSARDRERAAAAAVSAINTYYGRGDIPIGVYSGTEGRTLTGSAYTAKLRDEFPHTAKPDDQMPPALDVYRAALSAAADDSVTIVAVGFLVNVSELLAAEPELVRKKVKKLVVMGGAFPRSDRQRGEFNLACAPDSARQVAENWPGPLLFSGFEIGAKISTGKSLSAAAKNNPVRRAYELFGKDCTVSGRSSWDLTAVLAAVRAPELYWTVSSGGVCKIFENGANEWTPADGQRHFYLIEKTPPVELARLLDEMLAAPPGKK